MHFDKRIEDAVLLAVKHRAPLVKQIECEAVAEDDGGKSTCCGVSAPACRTSSTVRASSLCQQLRYELLLQRTSI